jgi:hypothetical protein
MAVSAVQGCGASSAFSAYISGEPMQTLDDKEIRFIEAAGYARTGRSEAS